MAFYDLKPSKLEAVGNGSHLYRYNIEEVVPEIIEGEEQTTQSSSWKCDEVTVWEPISANKITEAVITSFCPASREQKLVNEYNAAVLGLIGGSKTSDEAKAKIAAYKDFLEQRSTLKAMVDADCAELGIL